MTDLQAIRLLLEESIYNNKLADFGNFIDQAREHGILLDTSFFNSLSYGVNHKQSKKTISLLGMAAYLGRNEIVQYLLLFFWQKIDLNLSDADGNTALHLCIMGSYEEDNKFNKHADTIDLLLAYGADIKQKNNDELAPLQFQRSLNKSYSGYYTVENWVSDFFQTRDKVVQQKITRISTLLTLALSKQLPRHHHRPLSSIMTGELTLQEFCIFHATQYHQAEKQVDFGFKNNGQLQRSIKTLSKQRQAELEKLLTTTAQEETKHQFTLHMGTIALSLLAALIYDLTCGEPTMFSLIIAAMSATIFFSGVAELQIEVEAAPQMPIALLGHSEDHQIIDKIENHTPFSGMVFK